MKDHVKYLIPFLLYASILFSQKDPAVNEAVIKHINEYKANVFIFLSPECPLCQSYSLTMRKLYEEYHLKGIQFTGIVSGNSFTPQTVKKFQKKFNIPFSIVLDTNKLMAKSYHATITPEVIVVDSGNVILYSGRIDNWAYALGKKRKNSTEHDLKDALEDILQNREVRKSRTSAIGCFIE